MNLTEQQELDLAGGAFPVRAKVLVDLLRSLGGGLFTGRANSTAHLSRFSSIRRRLRSAR